MISTLAIVLFAVSIGGFILLGAFLWSLADSTDRQLRGAPLRPPLTSDQKRFRLMGIVVGLVVLVCNIAVMLWEVY